MIQNKNTHLILSRFKEGPLNFDPTYKYDDHSDMYDSSQKKRIPAWCDRVLYEDIAESKGKIDLLWYGRKESLFSDHRPVVAVFELQIMQENREKKKEIEKKLVD